VDLELDVLLELDDVADRRPDRREQGVEPREDRPGLGLRLGRRGARIGRLRPGVLGQPARIVDRGPREESEPAAGRDVMRGPDGGLSDLARPGALGRVRATLRNIRSEKDYTRTLDGARLRDAGEEGG
jgi:hypothetical protein